MECEDVAGPQMEVRQLEVDVVRLTDVVKKQQVLLVRFSGVLA